MTLAPVLNAGLETGGGNLNAASNGTQFDAFAGNGFALDVGTSIIVSDTKPHSFETQLTVGIRASGDASEDKGDVDWFRHPLQWMSFYRNTSNGIRAGGGISYQVGNELKGKDSRASASMAFEDALGLTAAIEFHPLTSGDQNLGWGLKFTSIDFKSKSTQRTVNGDSLLAYAAWIWR